MYSNICNRNPPLSSRQCHKLRRDIKIKVIHEIQINISCSSVRAGDIFRSRMTMLIAVPLYNCCSVEMESPVIMRLALWQTLLGMHVCFHWCDNVLQRNATINTYQFQSIARIFNTYLLSRCACFLAACFNSWYWYCYADNKTCRYAKYGYGPLLSLLFWLLL